MIPAYKYKKYHGVLIAACPPFNLFILPFLPIFWCNSKKKKLRSLNNTLVKIIFVPFALIYTSIFLVCNILLIPFAYVYTCYKKLNLVFNHSEKDDIKGDLYCNFFVFLVSGLFMLIIGLAPDSFYFFKHLYLQRNEELSSEVVNVISPEAFNTLEAVIQREVKIRKMKNPRD